ncbi:hypothetical protein [Roseivirga echinicomitans]|uniref:Uncharacterized protein n=1 Tax=Roseivirga echinicomitans TaxID=296218 RepID=A0A150X2I8_9BACT|nr:hypothetical protein [Roseivirga echinicomitans]KYG72822.1 hypothetical protein AWN68_08965 [Roseivirga echinicomitans]
MAHDEVKVPKWLIVLIVVILFFALIVYITTLGKVDIGAKGGFPEEFKENKEKAQSRHKKLVDLIAKKIEVKTKLERRFRSIYLWVRVLFVAAWAGLMLLGFHMGYINNLEDTLNYSEATLLIAFGFNFLCFGSLTNLERTLQHVKTRLENWIYGKYITIQDDIDRNQLELFQLKIDTQQIPPTI